MAYLPPASKESWKKGPRNGQKKEGITPKSGDTASTTPGALRTALETGKDIMPPGPKDFVFKSGTYHDYLVYSPNKATPQCYIRAVDFLLHGFSINGVGGGTAVPANVYLGATPLLTFWAELYLNQVHKAVRRDGYRHLPDTLTNSGVPKAYFKILLEARSLNTALLTLVNSESFNDATKSMRTKMGGKFRRLTNQAKTLGTFRCPADLAKWADYLFRIVAIRPGGAFVVTLPELANDIAPITGKAGGSYAAGGAEVLTSFFGTVPDLDSVNDVWDELLTNIDDAIATLNGTAPAANWNAGYQDDLKYYQILLEELGIEPIGYVEADSIIVDPGAYQNIMFGEAIYGYDLHNTNLYAFPVLDFTAATPFSPAGMIPRRGFRPPTDLDEMGVGEVWAAYHSEAANAIAVPKADSQVLFGVLIQINNESIAGVTYAKDAFRMYDAKNGWSNLDSSLDHNDGTACRTLMTSGNPLGDHQWNDFLFSEEIGNTIAQKGPAGLPAYQFHQPYLAPFESMRAELCRIFDVPFYR
jgi:hypothetical protein